VAARLHEIGCRGVVITGGHLRKANDYLSVWDSGSNTEQIFTGSRLDSRATHGTGCAFAAALACGLARGRSLPEAVGGAKAYVRKAILTAYAVGQGNGPMNHLYALDEPN
jgi:hydroxymethylpyrimidine/phosphomethylpyrimidine kinase